MIAENEKSFKIPERLSLKMKTDGNNLATVSSGHPEAFDSHD